MRSLAINFKAEEAEPEASELSSPHRSHARSLLPAPAVSHEKGFCPFLKICVIVWGLVFEMREEVDGCQDFSAASRG